MHVLVYAKRVWDKEENNFLFNLQERILLKKKLDIFNKSFIQHSDTLTDKQTGKKTYYKISKNALNSQNDLYNHNQEITCMVFFLQCEYQKLKKQMT